MLGSIARTVFGAFGIEITRRSSHRAVSLQSDLTYLLRDRPGTILDVGANVGQFSTGLLRWFPNKPIIAFEPVPETFEILKSKFTSARQITFVCAALGETSRSSHMSIKERSVWNRISENAGPATVPVSMLSLDDFCAESSIEHIALLKTDCEGYDANVIKGAKGLLKEDRIDSVYSEVNFSRDGSYGDFFIIHELLHPKFVLYGLYDYSPKDHPEFCNALWIKREIVTALRLDPYRTQR